MPSSIAAENAADQQGTQAAIQRDPSFLSAYNTLGVVYLRHGDLVLAEPIGRSEREERGLATARRRPRAAP